MVKRISLTLIIFLSAYQLSTAFQDQAFYSQYYKMADETFDQQQAFETVSFVEKFWRLAGNEGFDKSIYHVVDKLKTSGFVSEDEAKESDRFTYRIEKRAMEGTTWEPIAGSVTLKSGNELLNFNTNFNMIASHSYSTNGPKTFDVVYVSELSSEELDGLDLKDKLVFTEASPRGVFKEVVQERGAAGVITYRIPTYNQPEKNQNSISFTGIPRDEKAKSFGILLSFKAYEILKSELKNNQTQLTVNLETKIYESEELTLVAEIKGSKLPNERFVFSAHVQEPGANDNASGVGALTAVAIATAKLVKQGRVNPERTITYLFGDEIVSTGRYVQEDQERAKGIKWGMSLDMVGQNTALTGGTFLIEKMPDPAAIWTRGKEKHTEWGGSPMKKDQLKPHYMNDLSISVFEDIGKRKNWVVNFNPFEGGSDHVPFLRGNIPAVLLWHFTDQFYHTDQDRIDKVSATTLKNVGIGAMSISLLLTENKPEVAELLLNQIEKIARARMVEEAALSNKALQNGESFEQEKEILDTWSKYYRDVLSTVVDLEAPNADELNALIETAKSNLAQLTKSLIAELK
jgi:aminopeptidase YwaD